VIERTTMALFMARVVVIALGLQPRIAAEESGR
jgi:hypothetical protein